MKKLLIFGFIISLATTAQAFKKHSKIETKTDVKKSDVTIEFKVNPDDGLVINADENSPWLVHLKEVDGLTESEIKLTREKFDESIPGFKVTGKLKDAVKTQLQYKYRLVAFVCTKDKSRCYRDVHKGEIGATKTKPAETAKKPTKEKAKTKKSTKSE